MSFISAFAVFFIIWWVTLFAVLPIGVRSQTEDDDVTFGTEPGAPVRPDLGRKAIITTAISVLIFGVFYWSTVTMGWSVDDIPRFAPEF